MTGLGSSRLRQASRIRPNSAPLPDRARRVSIFASNPCLASLPSRITGHLGRGPPPRWPPPRRSANKQVTLQGTQAPDSPWGTHPCTVSPKLCCSAWGGTAPRSREREQLDGQEPAAAPAPPQPQTHTLTPSPHGHRASPQGPNSPHGQASPASQSEPPKRCPGDGLEAVGGGAAGTQLPPQGR